MLSFFIIWIIFKIYKIFFIYNYLNLNNNDNIGRIALIRFKNDFDGLKLYYNRNFFYLPLVDNKKGKPKMILGQILIDFIKKNQI